MEAEVRTANGQCFEWIPVERNYRAVYDVVGSVGASRGF